MDHLIRAAEEDELAILALADSLEEQGKQQEAEAVRLEAGGHDAHQRGWDFEWGYDRQSGDGCCGNHQGGSIQIPPGENYGTGDGEGESGDGSGCGWSPIEQGLPWSGRGHGFGDSHLIQYDHQIYEDKEGTEIDFF